MSIISDFKSDFTLVVEEAIENADDEIVRIGTVCDLCGWRQSYRNGSWVDRANLRSDCVEHAENHLDYGQVPGFDIHLVPRLDEIEVTVTIED